MRHPLCLQLPRGRRNSYAHSTIQQRLQPKTTYTLDSSSGSLGAASFSAKEIFCRRFTPDSHRCKSPTNSTRFDLRQPSGHASIAARCRPCRTEKDDVANCHGHRVGRDRGCRNIPFIDVVSEHLPNVRRPSVSIGATRNPAQASSPRPLEPLQFSHGNIWTCGISTDALVHDAQPNNCIDCRASWGLDHWLTGSDQ